jgi:hypothetical protein
VVVERGFSIRGVVVDREGMPLKQVYLEATSEDGQQRTDSGSTDAEGRFELVGLPDGLYALDFRRQDGTEERRIGVRGVRAGTADLRISFVPESDQRLSIEGTLVDESGAALANRRVRATATEGDRKYARTDDAGRFSIEGLEPGRYRLILMREYQQPYYLLVLGEAEAGAKSLVLVARKGTVIRGTVRYESGLAADVYACADLGDGDDPIVAKTDARGAFALEGIPPGARCNVTCNAMEEYVRAIARDVEAGAADVRLVLRRGLEAKGRVLRADGSPAAGTSVRLVRVGEPLNDRVARTDGAGRFHTKGLAAGTYEAFVSLDFEERPCGTIEAGATDVELRVKAK